MDARTQPAGAARRALETLTQTLGKTRGSGSKLKLRCDSGARIAAAGNPSIVWGKCCETGEATKVPCCTAPEAWGIKLGIPCRRAAQQCE